MNGSVALDLLGEHHDQIAAALARGLDDDNAFPADLDMTGVELGAGDYDQAQQLLTDLKALQSRVAGMQTRVAGELSDMRRRRPSISKPPPRAFDTSF